MKILTCALLMGFSVVAATAEPAKPSPPPANATATAAAPQARAGISTADIEKHIKVIRDLLNSGADAETLSAAVKAAEDDGLHVIQSSLRAGTTCSYIRTIRPVPAPKSETEPRFVPLQARDTPTTTQSACTSEGSFLKAAQ